MIARLPGFGLPASGKEDIMDRAMLGTTGLEVTQVAFGTWQLGGDWGDYDEREAIAAIRHARALGVNLFDTAQAYGFGVAERLLGEALHDELRAHREEIVLATKGGLRMDSEHGLLRDCSPAWLRQGVEGSLRNLGVERIDLYQVHWPDPRTPFAETGLVLDELRDEGKIAHVGVSNFSAEQMAELGRACPVETVQPPYHLFRREIERDVLPYARERDIGVLVYGPLAHGLLTGAMDVDMTFAADDWRRGSDLFQGEAFARNLQTVAELERFARERECSVSQLAIAWALANSAVDVAIVGARSAAHIEDSMGALDVRLSREDMREIDTIMAGSVPVAGPTPEGV
jgi:aryl-alcohol dehydrogenase-like predicted oxidoreductase